MKIKLIIVSFIFGLIFHSNIFSQNQHEKSDTLTLLLNKSKVNNQMLFLTFGWQGCGWCRIFDKYHSDTTVNEILSKYFMIAKIDIYKTKAGEELYKTYGKKGTPSWTIFNSEGKVQIDSDDGNGNIGFPAKESELDYYAQALKKAAPKISESECRLLKSKLKEYRNRKKQNVL